MLNRLSRIAIKGDGCTNLSLKLEKRRQTNKRIGNASSRKLGPGYFLKIDREWSTYNKCS